ncbi:tetratricopeptide repeat protein [Xenococcus sp. PCC 7305]|uniref:tetratricopeptide repeat protein n=1 Tax=Xenococcus sp. PCC 7305 TaxID=102125 RepID=UPI0002AC3723|nr:tetratricopeptide repeat protein [Xenococcus sp. PCC 7305]ELS05487.1 tetratricopeptide repeat protein [Xenococcus sp. PCC 7305]
MTQLNTSKTTEDFLQQGKAFKDQGLLDEAISVYQEALEFYQNSHELYHFLGETFAATNKLAAAVDAYKQAIAIHPQSHWSYHCLSLAYLWQKEYNEALECCEKSIQIDPSIPAFYNQMASVLNSQGELEKANIFYQKALEIASHRQDLNNITRENIEEPIEKPEQERSNKPREISQKNQEVTSTKNLECDFQGVLEEIDGCLLKGYSWNVRKPDEKQILVIYQNNQEVLRFAADRFREDLKKAGIGTGNYGFAVRLPLDVCQAAPFNLKITVAESDYVLEKSAIRFEYNDTYKTSFQGFCEPFTDEIILKGWALDNENLDRKISLYVYENHVFLFKLQANVYREDIHQWKQGDGHYGYWSQLPDDFLDNNGLGKNEHQLSICWGNSPIELSNSPVVIEEAAFLSSLFQRTRQNLNELVKITDEFWARNY